MKSTAFFLGIAIGAGIGYYLATEDKEELIERVKSSASDARDFVENTIGKGKRLVNDIRSKGEEV